jgi:hypothetical protein
VRRACPTSLADACCVLTILTPSGSRFPAPDNLIDLLACSGSLGHHDIADPWGCYGLPQHLRG